MKSKMYWGDWVIIGFVIFFIILSFLLYNHSFVFPINFTAYVLPYSVLFWILILLTILFGGIYWAFEWFKYPTNQRIKNVNYLLFIFSLLGIVVPIWWHINYSFDTIESQFSTYARKVFHIYANAFVVQFCASILLVINFILMTINITFAKIK